MLDEAGLYSLELGRGAVDIIDDMLYTVPEGMALLKLMLPPPPPVDTPRI